MAAHKNLIPIQGVGKFNEVITVTYVDDTNLTTYSIFSNGFVIMVFNGMVSPRFSEYDSYLNLE